MKWWLKGFIIILIICCQWYGLLASLAGNSTMAPSDGSGMIYEAVNLNDVFFVVASDDNHIYTLGSTCVQRFKFDGSFDKGAYFAPAPKRGGDNTELLSLSDNRIIVLNSKNEILIFDQNFNIINITNVDSNYDAASFYEEYPSNNSVNKQITLTLFNHIKCDGQKIELAAPRNFWFSHDFGLIAFVCCSIILGCIVKPKKDNT